MTFIRLASAPECSVGVADDAFCIERSDLDDCALAESLPRCNVHEASLIEGGGSRVPTGGTKGLSRRLREASLRITLIDLVLAKQTIPIVYSAGWAARRTVAEPQR